MIQNRLHLVKTITIKEAILLKIRKFISENAFFQGYYTEVSFDTSEGNQLSLLEKISIFPKFFGDLMRHIIR